MAIALAGATGNLNEAPSAAISGAATGLEWPDGIALDSNANIYVTNEFGGANGYGSVTVYPAGANGDVTPTATIANPNVDGTGGNAGDLTGLNYPDGIALDSSANIYVANEFGGANGYGSVTVYAVGASGNIAPIAAIANTNADSTGGTRATTPGCSRLRASRSIPAETSTWRTIAASAAARSPSIRPAAMAMLRQPRPSPALQPAHSQSARPAHDAWPPPGRVVIRQVDRAWD